MITEEQKKIIDSEEDHIVVVASAGAGKTFTIISKVLNIIKNTNPSDILLTSFSKSANEELKDRIKLKLDASIVNKIEIKTLHSVCFNLLSRFGKKIGFDNVNIVPVSYYIKIILNRAIFQDIDCFDVEDSKKLVDKIQRAKIYNNFTNTFYTDIEKDLYNYAEETMKSQNKMTFEDLLYKGLELLTKYPDIKESAQKYDYIIVDEAQDTSLTQFKIIECLLKKTTKTMIVMDAKQNIYGFRGAHYKYCNSFIERTNSKLFLLSETFRFGDNISNLANTVMGKMMIEGKYKEETKTNVPLNNDISYHFLNEDSTVKSICRDIQQKIKEGYDYNDLNILYRINKDSIDFQKELALLQIPFDVHKGSFLERREITYILNIIELCYNYDLDKVSFILKENSNNIDTTIFKKAFHEAEDKSDLLNILYTGFSKKINGIGEERKKSFKKLFEQFMKAKKRIIEDNDKKNLIFDLAEIMNINQTKMMFRDDSYEGDPLEERLAFLEELQEILYYSDKKNLIEWVNELKVEFMGTPAKKKNVVHLKTLHGSKGQTLPVVYLFLNNMANPYFMKEASEDEINQELFLLYVGITRAKDFLKIYHSNPWKFRFNFIFPEIPDTENNEQENFDFVLSDEEVNIFETNFKEKKIEVEFVDFSPKKSTEKAMLFKNSEGDFYWIPKSWLGCKEGKFYLPSWIVKRNSISI